MIQVSAVLSVAFGVELQVGLIGCASMTLPVNEPEPIAYVQIDFELALTPSSGLIAAFGKITPASFLYGGMVHLSGGFAFSAWFAGPASGNFVLTVGGYNPHYDKPASYPDVPRLQMRFGVDSLNVTGEAYFALVPHAMMAGLAIHATWSLGPLDAWFDARLDFLLDWKPFHYEAEGHVEIGVSFTIDVWFVTIRITVHVGVALQIWGPPFGGRAHVDLDVVSFTISFGDQPTHKPVDWTGFQQFLPSVNAVPPNRRRNLEAGDASAAATNKPLVNVLVASGLLKAFEARESPDGLDWLVDPNGFVLATQSAAPCTDAAFNSRSSLRSLSLAEYLDPADIPGSLAGVLAHHETPPLFAYRPAPHTPEWTSVEVGIPPMGLREIRSVHSVSVVRINDDGTAGDDVDDLIGVLTIGTVSPALWGTSRVSTTSLSGRPRTDRRGAAGLDDSADAVVPEANHVHRLLLPRLRHQRSVAGGSSPAAV